MRKFISVLLVLLFLAAGNAFACIVRYRDSSELKAEAGLVVRGTVLSRKAVEPAQVGELYSYVIQTTKIERGNLESGTKITVNYFNVRAREVDGILECPLKNGSGKETKLQVGASYRFYLKSIKDKEILLSEE